MRQLLKTLRLLHNFEQSSFDQDGAEVIKDITDQPRNSSKKPPTDPTMFVFFVVVKNYRRRQFLMGRNTKCSDTIRIQNQAVDITEAWQVGVSAIREMVIEDVRFSQQDLRLACCHNIF